MPTKSDVSVTGQEFMADFRVDVVKAEKSEDGTRGKVTALVSAYGKPYRMGFAMEHEIQPGAFAESLADNSNVPLFWQHSWNFSEQPPIGVAVGSESDRGLTIEGEFFLDTETGRSVFNAMKAGAIREWSIGYRIETYEVEETDDKDTIRVNKASLLEASAVLRGANPFTETLKVASEDGMVKTLAALTDTVVTLTNTVGELVKATAQVEQDLASLDERQNDIDAIVKGLSDGSVTTETTAPVEDVAETTRVLRATTPPEGSICVRDECGAKGIYTWLVSHSDGSANLEFTCDEHAIDEATKGLSSEPEEPATCWYLGCEAEATQTISITEMTAVKTCDEHATPTENAGSKGDPQPSAAGSGEEGSVEPTAEGGETQSEAASGSTLRVPDFLPPSDPDTDVDYDDITSQSRVMRAWQGAEHDAEIRHLTATRQ